MLSKQEGETWAPVMHASSSSGGAGRSGRAPWLPAEDRREAPASGAPKADRGSASATSRRWQNLRTNWQQVVNVWLVFGYIGTEKNEVERA